MYQWQCVCWLLCPLWHDAMRFSIAFEWHKTTETCRHYTFNSNNILRTAAEPQQQQQQQQNPFDGIYSFTRIHIAMPIAVLSMQRIKQWPRWNERVFDIKRKIHYCNTVWEFFPAMCHISRWPYAIRSLPFMRVMHAVCCSAYAISIKCLFFLLSFSISSSHRTSCGSLAFYHRINAGVVIVVAAVVCGMRRLCLCLHATVAGIHL